MRAIGSICILRGVHTIGAVDVVRAVDFIGAIGLRHSGVAHRAVVATWAAAATCAVTIRSRAVGALVGSANHCTMRCYTGRGAYHKGTTLLYRASCAFAKPGLQRHLVRFSCWTIVVRLSLLGYYYYIIVVGSFDN